MPIKSLPAITIKQPWAQLIMLGIKNIENRSWATDYRGEIFVHAGMKWDSDPWPDDVDLKGHGLSFFSVEKLPRGVILGTVNLAAIGTDSVSPWALPGQFHWVLSDPKPLTAPIPWRGQLGLWYPTKFNG